ncbi:MAG: tRNA (adenosine(37)-N6)-threonylcarbamoyltransferase complex dimerization subunit type 1 TsaB [Chloroflexota bacterium]
MRVLGIDTSAYVNAVGITDGAKVRADNIFEARNDSLERIVADIDATLKSAGLRLEDIDGFGIGLGPGSWTGIRVGVTVGKILAFSTGKPVAGVGTLEALAYQTREAGREICAVMGAGTRDAVYAARYLSEAGRVKQQGDYYVGSISGLAAGLDKGAIIVSSAEGKAGEEIERVLRSSVADFRNDVPRGAAMAALAAARLGRGESDDALALAPLYLKESSARAQSQRTVRGTGAGG